MARKTKRPGRRSAGAKPSAPTACRKCGSTDRAEYHLERTLRCGSDLVTWRRTHCLQCGQYRDDRTSEPVPTTSIAAAQPAE